jgi:rhomboid family GlyGly-CTERM serine protease
LSRLPILTLLLSAAAGILGLMPHAVSRLEYERTAIAAGEWWRVFMCHWTHFSADHLMWDVGAFALLGAICERRSRVALVRCVVVSAVSISAAVWVFLPHLQSYRGLSGIDSALFVLLAVDLLRCHARKGGRRGVAVGVGAVLVLFAGKIVVELMSGRTLFVDSTAAGMVPVPLAHLAGAGAGLLSSISFKSLSSSGAPLTSRSPIVSIRP